MMSHSRKYTLCLFISFFLLLLILSPAKVLSAPYYQGKLIKMIVGVSPGGGYDRMARLISKHLPKYIPGKPATVIENMPGASTIVAANYLYNIAKPDGQTIGTIFRSLLVAQLMKAEGMRFDLRKYAWIGSAGTEAYVLAIRSDLPYKTFGDLKKSKDALVLGATGYADMTYVFPSILQAFAGLNLKIAIYPASPEVMLAIERKEVDGRAGSYSSLKPFIERGLVRLLVRGRISEPGIENLPVNEDYAVNEKGKTIMRMYSAADQIGRPYVAPPGTPIEAINILRDGFAKAAKDPELREDAKKNMLEFDYVPADECLKVVNYVLNQPDDIVKEFSKYVRF